MQVRHEWFYHYEIEGLTESRLVGDVIAHLYYELYQRQLREQKGKGASLSLLFSDFRTENKGGVLFSSVLGPSNSGRVVRRICI